MSEEEWLSSTDPVAMLQFLRTLNSSERKVRLFACACVWDYMRIMDPDAEGTRTGVVISELYADGLVSKEEWWTKTRVNYHASEWKSDDVYEEASNAATGAATSAGWDKVRTYSRSQEREEQKYLTRFAHCIFGNPFRSITTDPSLLNETVINLARTIYDERCFDRMPVLADALEECGCTQTPLLEHLRGEGPLARGCFAVDLILGKS